MSTPREGSSMESVALGVFAAALAVSIIFGLPTVYALVVGLAAFCVYARLRSTSWGDVLRMCWHGLKPIGAILAMLALVGVLTGIWRAAGVIPAIVYYAVPLIGPAVFVVATFLLNCLVSVLTGTSFGTAATMGSICLSMAASMGVPMELAGGAALSGAFFGDRCSPLSTSALLVADITGTDFYNNLKRMVCSAFVPFISTVIVFALAGLATGGGEGATAVGESLSRVFDLNPIVLAPPVLVFALALLRVKILVVIAVGIASAIPLCLGVQHMDLLEVARTAVTGYVALHPGVEALAGGGLLSMADAVQIVCITSAYAGIFEETPLLGEVQGVVGDVSSRLSSFAATLAVSVFASIISCNQTLAIMLTHQLCRDFDTKPDKHALDLEDSVVLVAGLVPWSIAGAVPLASMGAPIASMAFAVYLYAVPLWRLAAERLDGRRRF